MKFQTRKKVIGISSIIMGIYFFLNILFTPFPKAQIIILGILLVLYCVLIIIMLRCPYCNKHIRSTKYNHCPYCGKDLVDE